MCAAVTVRLATVSCRAPPSLPARAVALLALVALAPCFRRRPRRPARDGSALHNRLSPAAGAYVIDLATEEGPLQPPRQPRAGARLQREALYDRGPRCCASAPRARWRRRYEARSAPRSTQTGVLRGEPLPRGRRRPRRSATPGSEHLQPTNSSLAASRSIDGAVIGDEVASFDTLRGGPRTPPIARTATSAAGSPALAWRHGRAAGRRPRQGRGDQARRAAQGARGRSTKAQATRREAQQRSAGWRSRHRGRARWPRSPSPTIATLIAGQTTLPSENFYAEMLVKALGALLAPAAPPQRGPSPSPRAAGRLRQLHPELAELRLRPLAGQPTRPRAKSSACWSAWLARTTPRPGRRRCPSPAAPGRCATACADRRRRTVRRQDRHADRRQRAVGLLHEHRRRAHRVLVHREQGLQLLRQEGRRPDGLGDSAPGVAAATRPLAPRARAGAGGRPSEAGPMPSWWVRSRCTGVAAMCPEATATRSVPGSSCQPGSAP